MPALLPRLDFTPESAARLPRKDRAAVAEFLVRWRAWDEAAALLDLWPDDGYVTTIDLRARAFSGLGRHDEALAAMAQRLEQKDSVSARGLQARLTLTAGDPSSALAAAQALIEQAPANGPLWSLMGDALLQRGALDEAEAAYYEHRSLAPNSRQPDLGLARVALARRDLVTATAFAVRALAAEGVEFQASVDQLHALRDLFTALDEQNHQADVEQQIQERLETELADLLAQLDGPAAPASAQAGTQAGAAPAAPVPTASQSPAPDAPVAVSSEAQARFAAAAQRLFGFPALRPAQAEILAAVDRGEDVLAILPTGAGKSLTYQLTAFLDMAADEPETDGNLRAQPLTLVISPLIALMKDQVEGLPAALQPHAIALNSSYEGDRLRAAFHDLRRGRYRLLYVAPERLRQRPFMELVRRRGVVRLVIDEVHCVSVWGHNFRPDYLYIAQAHKELGAPPVLALTATAPPRVREDIEQRLFGREGGPKAKDGGPERNGGPTTRVLRRIALDSYRPNLRLGAIEGKSHPEKRALLLKLCDQYDGSGIVYARARQQCEDLAALLREHGHDALHYHAGMGDQERAAAQEAFMTGGTRIMVATVAFGMGVDKPDIRFIVHYGLPSSLEAYYQEAGRAGRDGAPAHCVLLYSSTDKAGLTALAKQDAVGVEMLRGLYKAVRTRTGGRAAAVAAGDLQRDTGLTDTQFRVALSMLEQAGMVRRHDDVPVSVNLRLAPPPHEPALRAFAERAQLQPGFWIERTFMALAESTLTDPAALERTLLDWQAAGALEVQSSGRALLLELLPPPRDGEARVQSLLGRIEAVQQQQATEIYKYAQTRRCRHGYLSAYLGGQPRKRCGHCDNCGGVELPALESLQPDSAQVEQVILRALGERMMGPATLLRVLAGDNTVDDRYRKLGSFGALPFVAQRVVRGHLETLAGRGLVEQRTFDSGATVYQLTQAGTAALRGQPRPHV